MKKSRLPAQFLVAMIKFTCFHLFLVVMTLGISLAGNTYSQEALLKSVTIRVENKDFRTVLSAIEKKTHVKFSYDLAIVPKEKLSIKVVEEPLVSVLDKLLDPLRLKYSVSGKYIILSRSSETSALIETLGETDAPPPLREVKGRVTDEKGEALPGVSILIKGTQRGMITDADGMFSLDVPDQNAVLVFSFVGYESREVLVGNMSNIEISLEIDEKSLDEVVVTALGISRDKRSLGYSIGELSGEKVQQVPQENVLNALTGKVAGLKITNTNNDLNSDTQVVIRGRTSLAGMDAPLIVIDGLPVGHDATVVADLNANSVASVSVLKGPSAAALYGSRAGNGVLLITTKGGDHGQKGIGVSFNSGYTASVPYHYVKQQHRFTNGVNGEFNEQLNTHWYGPEEGTPAVQWNTNGQAEPLKFYRNNMRDFFQTGNSFINDISVQGANNKGAFRLAFSDMRGTGIYPGTELTKNALDLAASYNVTNRFKLGASVHVLNTGSDNFDVQGHDDYQYEDIFFVPNHVNVHDLKDYWQEKDVQQLTLGSLYNNPYFTAHAMRDQFRKVRAYGNVKFDWELTDELSLMGRLGNSKVNNIGQTKIPKSDKWKRLGYYRYNNSYSEETNLDFLLSYKKDFDDFSLNLSGGGNALYLSNSNIENNGANLTLPGLYTVSNIDRAALNFSSYVGNKRIYSMYGIASLGYRDFLYLDLTARNDWSSTLPKGNNSYFYPSASLSVLLSQVLELPRSVSLLKLRGGWAEVGKDTDPYQTMQLLSRSTWGPNVQYSLPNTMYNKNLKPENAVSAEVGFDLSMFQKRVNLNATYYQVSNENQILDVPIDVMSGYTSAKINAGIVQNRGLEIELLTVPVQMKDFSWDLGFVFTRDRSWLKKLADGIDTYQFWESTGVFNRTRLGEKIGDMYGYDVLRVQDGEYAGWPLLDANGKVQRDPDPKKMGNVISNFMLGIQTGITYKRFSISANFDWRQGGDYYSMTMLRLARGGMIEDWHNGIHSSTFTGILSNNSFGGNRDQIAQEIKSNPEVYRDNLTWVGGRTEELGGFAYNGRNNGAFFPGVRPDGQGGYIENFGGSETALFASNNIIDPGGGWWSQGTQMWMYDASYLKMREFALSYQFSKEAAGIIRAQSLSLAFFAKNLMLWTKAKNGIDPELAYVYDGGGRLMAGFDRWNAAPWTASLGFKLNVQF